MCSTDDEHTLQHQLAGLSKADPSYATTLSDLATIKLNQGKTSEAQALLEQLRTLRLGDIAALTTTNFNDRQSPASGPNPLNAAATIVDKPSRFHHEQNQAEKNPAMVTTTDAAPCLEAPGDRNPSAAMTSATATSSSTVATTPPASRTRGLGSGGRGMGGGVALFARALGVGSGSASGGSRPGSGTRSQSGSRSGSVTRGNIGSAGLTSTAAAAMVTSDKATAAAAAAAALAMQNLGGQASSANSKSGDASTAVATGRRSGSPTHGTAATASEPGVLANGDTNHERCSASLGLPPENTRIEPPGSSEAAPPAVQAPDTAATATAHSDDVLGGTTQQGPAAAQSPVLPLPPPPVVGAALTTMQHPPNVAAVTGPAASTVTSSMMQHSPPAIAVAAVASSSSSSSSSSSGAAVAAAAAAAAMASATHKRTSQAVAAVSAMLSGSNRSHIVSAAAALMAANGSGCDVSRGGMVAETSASGGAAGSDDSALRATLGECTHVLEVYGLTTAVRTAHLEEFVMAMAPTDGRPLPTIKWVDDEHALLVCPDGATALWMLQEDQDLFRLRPFSEASPGSRAIAAAELLPPRERPKTTAAVAKKMLSHALGMSQLRDRGAEKDLAQQRKAAREARREREQKLAAAWDED